MLLERNAGLASGPIPGGLSNFQVPPSVNVRLGPALTLLGRKASVPGHALDLRAQDPARLCLNPLFRDLQHRSGITGELRPRQTVQGADAVIHAEP